MGKSEENRLKPAYFSLSCCYAKALSYTLIMANVISTAKKLAVISALIEGCSVRSTVRMTGVSKGAVLRLLEDGGTRGSATDFLQDVEGRLSNRIQLPSDGHKMYLTAVADSFASGIDYAQLVKVFGNDPEGEKRYSPAQCQGIIKNVISGDPSDPSWTGS